MRVLLTICASIFSFSPIFLVSIRSHSISIRTVYSTIKETGSSLHLPHHVPVVLLDPSDFRCLIIYSKLKRVNDRTCRIPWQPQPRFLPLPLLSRLLLMGQVRSGSVMYLTLSVDLCTSSWEEEWRADKESKSNADHSECSGL